MGSALRLLTSSMRDFIMPLEPWPRKSRKIIVIINNNMMENDLGGATFARVIRGQSPPPLLSLDLRIPYRYHLLLLVQLDSHTT